MEYHCQQMTDLLASIGEEMTEQDQMAIQSHLENCGFCTAQFNRVRWIVRYVAELPADTPPDTEHLTDMELASFAWARFNADDADRIVKHLAQCQECRRAVAAVRVALDEYEAEERARSFSWDQIKREMRMGMSSPTRFAALLGAAASYMLECLLLAAAVGHLLLAYAIAPTGYEAVPAVFPLSLVAEGAGRLWALVTAALAGGVGFRQLAVRLYRKAVRLAASGQVEDQ